MKKKNYPAVLGGCTKRVLDALVEEGPMTSMELASHLGLPHKSVRNAIGSLRKARKQVYVSAWVDDAEGERRYPRPVLSAGGDPDVKRPARSPAQRKATHAERQRTLRVRSRANSVFNLGGVNLNV